MASLDIRPHSPRVSGWALAGLMLLGAGAFAAGVVHQLAPTAPLPFPPAQQDNIRIAVAAPPLEPVAQARGRRCPYPSRDRYATSLVAPTDRLRPGGSMLSYLAPAFRDGSRRRTRLLQRG